MTSPGALLDERCPRCSGSFQCGARAGHCACFGVQLGDALRAEIAARYPDRCLCLRCLRELADGPPPQAVIGGAAASG